MSEPTHPSQPDAPGPSEREPHGEAPGATLAQGAPQVPVPPAPSVHPQGAAPREDGAPEPQGADEALDGQADNGAAPQGATPATLEGRLVARYRAGAGEGGGQEDEGEEEVREEGGGKAGLGGPFRLHPPALLTRFRLFFGILALWWAVEGFQGEGPLGGLVPWQLYSLAGALLGVVALLAWHLKWRLREGHSITLEAEGFRIPHRSGSLWRTRVSYEGVRALLRMNGAPQQTILIDTDRGVFIFSSQHFREPSGPSLLWASLLERIHALPDGRERLGRMNRLVQLAQLANAQPTRLTWAMLGMVLAGFGLQSLWGSTENLLHLVRMGANVPVLVVDHGQWYRLVTANFLHGGWLHLGLNAWALLYLGVTLERLMGPVRLLLLFFGASLGGALASTWAGQGVVAVGVSTALFGYLGALGTLQVMYPGWMPPLYRQTGRWWFFSLGFNALLPLLVPMIDMAAHLGGFVAGAVLTWAMHLGDESFVPSRPAPWSVRSAMLAVGLVFLSGLAVGSARLGREEPNDYRALVRDAARRAGEERDHALNAVAWYAAIDHGATPAQLEVALEAMDRARESTPAEPALMDTEATVRYRLAGKQRGSARQAQIAQAVGLEHEALQASVAAGNDSEAWMYASQLARFLAGHQTAAGVYRAGTTPEGLGLRLEQARVGLVPAAGGHRVVIEGVALDARPAQLTWVVRDVRGEALLGLVQACVGPGGGAQGPLQAGIVGGQGFDASFGRWPKDARFDVSLVEAPSKACEGVEGVRSWAWSMSPEVVAMPAW